MVRALRTATVTALAMTLAVGVGAQLKERVDYDAIYKIKDEGFQRSKVMETMSYLTDVYGPRLTGSPNIKQAGDWAVARLTDWGLSDAKLEPWGSFGKGWVNDRVSIYMTAPTTATLIGYPKAWTQGTTGALTAEVVMAPIENERDFDKYRGQLKGKFVLTQAPRELRAHWDADARRLAEKDLAQMAVQDPVRQGRPYTPPATTEFIAKRTAFYRQEGAAALIDAGRVGDGGTVFVQGGGSRDPKDAPATLQITLAAEHYNRIVRILEKKIPVTLEINAQNRFLDADLSGFNVVAELPGTDKADEVVMLGAHFDSWHTGTGATDNAAGSAMMMEAARILKATGVKLRRTVRIALWSGEEQGLLGSRGYVTNHFADRQTMQLKADHAKFAGYFNVDNGTGAIRGVYLQGNEAVAPIFSAWMEPFANLGMTSLTIANTGGTDHLAFDAVGLPGFQFIQDPVEYDTRTHHSNMDVYDRVQASDMMKNAVIVASFVYHTANRDEKLPRKPLPKPSAPTTTTASTGSR